MMSETPDSLTTLNTLCDADAITFSIKPAMTKLFFSAILIFGCAQAQVAVPATSGAKSDTASPSTSVTDAPLPGGPRAKVGLVRGVVKRLDPIHDQLLIHSFGGGDVRIAFDGRTQLLPGNPGAYVTSIPKGSVVSVDTVIDGGKLFARSVRTGPSNGAELNGQVLRYDAAKSQLTLRDPISPEGISLHVSPNATVVNQGQAASPQALSAGMLVKVWLAPTQNSATRIEILAQRGNSFTFEGRIVAVDLRSGVMALSNDSDKSVRELTIGSLDSGTLGLLREGANVNIQAEFDGDRYNVRSVTLAARNP